MTKGQSSRDTSVARRTADAGAGLDVSLFSDLQPLADPHRSDSPGAADAQRDERAGSGDGREADADPGIDFDTARLIWPGIGIAVYAMEPGQPITLEVHADGEVYAFTAATLVEALAVAFPARPEPVAADIFG